MKVIVLLSVVLFCIVSQVVISAPKGSFVYQQKHKLWMSVFNVADYLIAPEYFVAPYRPMSGEQYLDSLISLGSQKVNGEWYYFNMEHWRVSSQCFNSAYRLIRQKSPHFRTLHWTNKDCINSRIFSWFVVVDAVLRREFAQIPWAKPKTFEDFDISELIKL